MEATVLPDDDTPHVRAPAGISDIATHMSNVGKLLGEMLAICQLAGLHISCNEDQVAGIQALLPPVCEFFTKQHAIRHIASTM